MVNIAFINKSPKGLRIVALSFKNPPSILPKIIDPIRMMEKR